MKVVNKNIFTLILVFAIFSMLRAPVKADWWDRPTARPTQPSADRLSPTSGEHPTSEPTNPPSGPTLTPDPGDPSITPGTGGPGGNGEENGDDNGGDDDEDPCAPGKSYTGPYCGWSPDSDVDDTSNNVSQGSVVLGLSDTSSEKLPFSDIMQLAGILCLLLYARSKIGPRKSL